MNRISVIVPLYQGNKYIDGLIYQIEKCAEKIEGYLVELIFSNDDPKQEVAAAVSSAVIDIIVVNTKQNRGIHGARVRGLEYSKGDFILFLDQDDEIDELFLKKQIRFLEHYDYDAVVCNALSAGRIKYNVDRPLIKAISKECMIREGCMILSPGQVLMRREAVSEIWKRNIMHKNGADDWLLWVCMHAEGKKFAINDEVLFRRKMHYSNTSFDSLKMAESEKEAVAIIENHGILSAQELYDIKRLLPMLQINRVKENEKWKKQFMILSDWMFLKQHGVGLGSYLETFDFKTSAIYGYGELGKNLAFELRDSAVSVKYFLDRNADFLFADTVPVYKLEDNPEKVDVVVITLLREMVNRQNKRLSQKWMQK